MKDKNRERETYFFAIWFLGNGKKAALRARVEERVVECSLGRGVED